MHFSHLRDCFERFLTYVFLFINYKQLKIDDVSVNGIIKRACKIVNFFIKNNFLLNNFISRVINMKKKFCLHNKNRKKKN